MSITNRITIFQSSPKLAPSKIFQPFFGAPQVKPAQTPQPPSAPDSKPNEVLRNRTIKLRRKLTQALDEMREAGTAIEMTQVEAIQAQVRQFEKNGGDLQKLAELEKRADLLLNYFENKHKLGNLLRELQSLKAQKSRPEQRAVYLKRILVTTKEIVQVIEEIVKSPHLEAAQKPSMDGALEDFKVVVEVLSFVDSLTPTIQHLERAPEPKSPEAERLLELLKTLQREERRPTLSEAHEINDLHLKTLKELEKLRPKGK